MTAAAWPDPLPAPAANSVSVAQVDLRAALTMDSGQVRRIRRGSGAPFHIRARLLLTGAQLDAFRHFYRFELRDGAWWFTAAWLDSLGLAGHAARFVEPPAFTRRTAFITEAELRLEAVDVANALDTGDWPISNVVTPAGIPTDHIAFWLKPDSWGFPPGHAFVNGDLVPSHHDPAVAAVVYRSGAVEANGGILGYRLGAYTYVHDYSGPTDAEALKIPFPPVKPLTVALVYSADSGVGVTLYHGCIPLDNVYSQPGLEDYNLSYPAGHRFSAEPARVRMAIDSGPFTTNPEVPQPPQPYRRVALFRVPFALGNSAAWFNGQVQVSNHAPRTETYGYQNVGGVKNYNELVIKCNLAPYGSRYAFLHELVVWGRLLTDAEVAAVHNHFIDKYQIPL